MKFVTASNGFTFNVNAITHIEHHTENDQVDDTKVVVYFISDHVPHIVDMPYQALLDVLIPQV